MVVPSIQAFLSLLHGTFEFPFAPWRDLLIFAVLLCFFAFCTTATGCPASCTLSDGWGRSRRLPVDTNLVHQEACRCTLGFLLSAGVLCRAQCLFFPLRLNFVPHVDPLFRMRALYPLLKPLW
jgi:hypothetical protein